MAGLYDTIEGKLRALGPGSQARVGCVASAECRHAGHPTQAQKTLAFPLKIYDKQKFLAREAQGIRCFSSTLLSELLTSL